jgi:hypothetical protein
MLFKTTYDWAEEGRKESLECRNTRPLEVQTKRRKPVERKNMRENARDTKHDGLPSACDDMMGRVKVLETHLRGTVMSSVYTHASHKRHLRKKVIQKNRAHLRPR